MAADPDALPSTVRDALPDDVAAIAEVHVASWRAAYAGLLPDAVLAGLSVDRRARQWARVVRPGTSDHVLVAESGGQVVGFAHVGPAHDADTEPGTGQLATIYLHPDGGGRASAGRSTMPPSTGWAGTASPGRSCGCSRPTTVPGGSTSAGDGERDGRIRVQQFGGGWSSTTVRPPG